MKITRLAFCLAILSGLSLAQINNGTSLPKPSSSGQCLVSTGSTIGAYTWGSCAGTSSTNWSSIVPGTGTVTAGTFNVGTGSTLTATGTGVINATQLGGKTFAAPAAIGSGTPAAGSFTTLSASGQVTSTVTTGTAPFVIASTTVTPNLNAALLNGATFAAPGAIGGTTPGSGAFTTLTGTSSLTLGVNGGTGGSVILEGSTSGSATISVSATGTLALPSGTTATSMSLTTPTLGVATATSINKVAITAPATSATLTIADGKTLTASNTLTLAGTDSTTMTFPSTSGTVLTAASTATLTNKTFDTAATGNVLDIGGVGVTSSTPSATQCLQSNSGATAIVWASCATGSVGGSGTTNTMAKFTAASTLGNSLGTDDGTTFGYSGSGGLNLSAGPLKLTDIVAPTGGAGFGLLYSDSTSHRITMKNGAGSAVNVVASGADINTSDQVTATHLTSPMPTAQGGTAKNNSTATFPTSGTVAVGGTCTNQAVTATSGTGVTCTTLTSAYVNNTIALTGADINTSNQVTATHLASPLPSAQGGTANAFFTVAGLATSAKTFTFPNASANVLTDNAAVTAAQGGTGSTGVPTSGNC